MPILDHQLSICHKVYGPQFFLSGGLLWFEWLHSVPILDHQFTFTVTEHQHQVTPIENQCLVCQSFLAWNLGWDSGVYLYRELLWAFVWLISPAWEAFELFLESWDLCLDVDFSALCWCLLVPNIIVSWKILLTFYISPRTPDPTQNPWVIEQAWALCAIWLTKSTKTWSKQNICILHGIYRAQATILFMEYKYNTSHCSQADTHCQLLIVFGMLQLGTWNQCTAP